MISIATITTGVLSNEFPLSVFYNEAAVPPLLLETQRNDAGILFVLVNLTSLSLEPEEEDHHDTPQLSQPGSATYHQPSAFRLYGRSHIPRTPSGTSSPVHGDDGAGRSPALPRTNPRECDGDRCRRTAALSHRKTLLRESSPTLCDRKSLYPQVSVWEARVL